MQVQLSDKYDEIFSFYNEVLKNTSKLLAVLKIPKTPYTNKKNDCFEQR